MVNLSNITRRERAFFLAYDQGLEHGPSDFNDENIDPQKIIEIAKSGFFTGIIFQKGIAEKYYKKNSSLPPLIVKLNGKTKLQDNINPLSLLLCTIDEALSLGAKAVGYTVYLGSSHEEEMLSELAQVVREAHEKSIPVIGWMYPRGEKIKNPHDPEITAYAARIGLELGCDMVKVFYPGTLLSAKEVVRAAGETKVVFSGGEFRDEDEVIRQAKEAIAAGAAGLAIGRNIWQRKNSLEISEKLSNIIFGQSEILINSR